MLKRSPWLQLALGYAALEAAFWTEGRNQAIASLAAAVVIIALTFLSLRPAEDLGLHWPHWPQSLWPVLIGAIAAWGIVLLALATGSLHSLSGQRAAGERAALYFVWAVVQQFILQSFFYVRVESRLGDSWKTVFVTAVLFALAHIPNPVLVPATFAGGLFFCGFFRKYRTIYPLAAAHGLLGLAVAIAVPDAVIHHMKIGLGYLHYP
jgi:membrane protease YdiL (CAAX protease family)